MHNLHTIYTGFFQFVVVTLTANVLQGLYYAYDCPSQLTIVKLHSSSYYMSVIEASLSEPHTGGSLSWFRMLRVPTVTTIKYDCEAFQVCHGFIRRVYGL